MQRTDAASVDSFQEQIAFALRYRLHQSALHREGRIPQEYFRFIIKEAVFPKELARRVYDLEWFLLQFVFFRELPNDIELIRRKLFRCVGERSAVLDHHVGGWFLAHKKEIYISSEAEILPVASANAVEP